MTWKSLILGEDGGKRNRRTTGGVTRDARVEEDDEDEVGLHDEVEAG